MFCLLHCLSRGPDGWKCRPCMDADEAAVKQLPVFESVSDKDLRTAAHFCNYAFAAYGYMLYIWSQPSSKCAPSLALAKYEAQAADADLLLHSHRSARCLSLPRS